jgi:protein gp37
MPTKIQWCMNPDGTPGEVWNPVTGCQKVSQGCRICYAERIAKRFWGERKFTDVVCHEDRLDVPLHWNKPRRVFVNSMSDLFHPDVPDEFIERVFGVMDLKRKRWDGTVFMILTKRAARMAEWINKWYGGKNEVHAHRLSNIWLGVSVENQQAADERIPLLLKTPAGVRFLSCEPLLGHVLLDNGESSWLSCDGKNHSGIPGDWHCCESYDVHGDHFHGIDWVIAGGESGPGARPMHPQWAQSLKDQCQAARVPYFFKQWGEWVPRGMAQLLGFDAKATENTVVSESPYPVIMSRVGKKAAGRLLDGREWNEFPEAK